MLEELEGVEEWLQCKSKGSAGGQLWMDGPWQGLNLCVCVVKYTKHNIYHLNDFYYFNAILYLFIYFGEEDWP